MFLQHSLLTLNIVGGGGEGDFALPMLIVCISSSSRSTVTSNFDDSAPLDLSFSLVPSRSARDGGKLIRDCRGGMTPTLLPREEYIVPFGPVLKYLPINLNKALARTAKLQTMREIQSFKSERLMEEVSKAALQLKRGGEIQRASGKGEKKMTYLHLNPNVIRKCNTIPIENTSDDGGAGRNRRCGERKL
jgi:hypothetical protein